MSGAQTSTFTDPNILYKTLSGAGMQEVEQNRLLNVQRQQDIAANNTEVVARAASTLIDPSLYPTEEARAAAWPGIIKQLKANGYAPNAPETYPGLQHLQMTARMGTPSADLYKYGLDRTAKGAVAPTPSDGGTTATGGTGGGGVGGTTAAAPATSSGPVEPDALARAQAVRDGLVKRGLDVDTATAFAANSLHESSANPNTGPGDAGASHGLFQWRADRYDRYKSVFGNAPDNAPLDQQLDYVVHELGTTEGAARDRIAAAQGPAAKAAAVSQFYLRPKDVQPEMARRSGTATQLATQWGGAVTSTAAPVITGDSLASQEGLGGSGVRGDSPAKVLARVQADSRAGKYNGQPVVLSTGASNNPTDLASVEQQIREAQGGNAGKITVLGVGPAVEAKAPGTNAKLQALAKSYGADFVPLPADQMSPDGVHPTAQGYAALKAAIAPPQGASGGVAARVGGTDVAGPGAGSGAPTAPPAALPRDQAVVQAQRTGQPVPVAGVAGLWALPNGNLSSTPPTAQQQPQVPQPPPNRVMPGGPDGPPVQQPSAPVATATQPPAADTLPPLPAPTPPEPRNRNGLTAAQQHDIDNQRYTSITSKELQAKVDAYRTANDARDEKYQADQIAYLREARERQSATGTAEQRRIENQRQADTAVRQAQAAEDAHAKALRDAANEGKLEQSKSDLADSMRVMQTIAPKIRAGIELTPEEADQYDLHRHQYAKGPLQIVGDGKGGTVQVYAGQEVPDRFPPLPGQKEYAGLKPIPGTEKQPDFAPANAITAMLDIGEGQRKIMRALENLKKYPGGVGLIAGSQPAAMSNWTDPAGVDLRADVGDVKAHIYHTLSGSAVTSIEEPRLQRFTPQEIDNAPAVKKKLERMLELNRETQLDHYRAFGPEAGGRRNPAVEDSILATIPQESIDAVREDPKRAQEFDKKYGRGASKVALSNG